MKTSEKPLALIMMPPIGNMIEAISTHCRVKVLAEIADRDAFFAAKGSEVRIVVTTGGAGYQRKYIDAMPNLGLIACFGSGYEDIEVSYVRSRGIEVTNARAANSEDVADLAIGLMLSVVRMIGQGDRMVRAGGWVRKVPLPTARSVSELRHGIIGLGAIGMAIARRLQGFGAQIAWWGPNPEPESPWLRAPDALALALECDVLYVAARASEANRGLVSRGMLDALGPGGYLVNVARGMLVDEPELISALREGRIAGAGIDTFASEPTNPAAWREIESVVLSPHLGGWASRALTEEKRQLSENIRRFLAGEALMSPVF